ncbi:hypothetical protein E1A91_A02G151900v1 [Gossypium mustelinum]|uniref:Uncharacterized protein n=1 Tax=Gossypium mustelinum TaxID=34275 RepID=A0A5D3A9M1_GOSMU|nr:hypothetical protein E1A91_A02G151800v1 [Gossypium mustelinum]TYJ46909.1 hypothetical protein E1A91_A02G151900v1 [Gossypium mustelinum]
MYDLGDEVTIESYRIPWLIWIQIIVLLLLMLLLYGFTLFAFDLPETSSSSSSSSPDSQLGKLPGFKQTTTFSSQVIERQSIRGEIGIAKTRSRRMVRGEEMEGSSRKEPNQQELDLHPCHYFRLAKLAFLKCLGLDSDHNNNTSITEQRNQR